MSIPTVPEAEIRVDHARSSGPGGQNVNKVSSKVRLRWGVGASKAFTEEQKTLIRAFAGSRLTKEDEVVLAAESERSQLRNKEEAVRRLQEIVQSALIPKEKRRPTKISRAQKRRRVEQKRITGERKKSRRMPREE